MALKSLHHQLLTQFADRLTPESLSLETLQTAFRCLFQNTLGVDGKPYVLVHWPSNLLKSITDLPSGAQAHVLQWYRIGASGAIPNDGAASSSVAIKARDPFRKELLLYGPFGSVPTLLLAREEPYSTKLFRSRPAPYSVIWTSDPEVLKAVRSLLGKEFPEWFKRYGRRLKVKDSQTPSDGNAAVWGSMKSMDLNYRSLIMERWKSAVEQRFQQMGWDLSPEALIRQVARAFKEHTSYDHFELIVKHYPGLPSQPDGAFSLRESKLGGELLSIILEPERTAHLLRSRHPVFMADIKKYPVFMNPGLLTIMNIRSGILMPLWEGNDELGLVKVFFQRRVEILHEEEKLLLSIAGDIGRALSNALKFHLTERRATVDGLTDVFNHRFFTDQVRKEFNRARRYKNALALIMIDINHFKEYNDANGHPAGDRVLAKVAELIQGSVREIDLVARYGGDEFALILPENDARQGMIVAEKVRKVIENYQFENEESLPGGKLTISLGISDNSQDIKSAHDMIEVADQALYWVKRHGGNRSKIGKRGSRS